MYDVTSYYFSEEDCWFKNKCPDRGDKEKCHCACPLYFQYFHLINKANVPKKIQYPENQILQPGRDKNEFERLSCIKNDIVDWVCGGNNLLLFSDNYGNGKTTWAVKLMSAYFSKICLGNGDTCRGLFINVDEFLMNKQNQISNYNQRFAEMEKLITTVDLVIWDDIGCTKLSDYNHSILFPYINTRLINGLSNIFTTNVIDEDLSANIGGRLADRILGHSEVIEFINTSRRG